MVVRGGGPPGRGGMGGPSFRGGPGRGGFRGGFRGGHGHYNHGGPPGGRNSVFIPFQAFDIEHCEHHFPRITTAQNGQSDEDSKLSELLLQRNKMIVPDPLIISGFDALYNEIETVANEYKKEGADGAFESIFEEIRKVGAYSNETLIEGVKSAEMLLVFKEAPELTQGPELVQLFQEKLEGAMIEFDAENAEVIVKKGDLKINVFLTCNGQKIRSVTETHFSKKVLYRNFDMRKRSHWFGEFAQEPNVRVLARLIGDMRCRYQGLRGLTQWSVELLAHYCVTGVKYNEQGQLGSLSIAAAFRRFLMILSSGFFLPGSSGIRDPIERDGRSVHQNFNKADMDAICATMQTLLRVTMQGAPEKVIGLESSNVCDEMQIIDGVVIQPSQGCYTEDEVKNEEME